MSYCRNKHVLFPMNKKATNSTLSICYLLRKSLFAKPCYNKRFFISKIWNYLKNTYLALCFS